MPMLVVSCDSPPAATPPTVPGSGSSPPRWWIGRGIYIMSFGCIETGSVCGFVGGLVHLGIGDPVVNQCCPLIQGVAELEAALCLCTTIRLKLLNVNVILPLALDLFVQCGLT